jgi:hypothetical protein
MDTMSISQIGTLKRDGRDWHDPHSPDRLLRLVCDFATLTLLQPNARILRNSAYCLIVKQDALGSETHGQYRYA